jgi:hypothetical protein
MTPSIHPELLLFRAIGPEPVEHWLMPENIPQSGANVWPEESLRCPETRVTGLSGAMPGSCGHSKRVSREVPGGPDQTQNA